MGVFCSFMPMGLIGLLIPRDPGNLLGISTVAVFTGLIAMGWASAFVYGDRRLLLLVIPLQYLIPWQFFPWLGRQGYFDSHSNGLAVQPKRSIMVLVAITSMIVGYVLAMRLARRLGNRGLKAKAELDMASAIHRSLVPDLDLRAGKLHVLGSSRASNEMGGDLIDVDTAEGRTDVLLADVSGHGVAAGIVMGMVKSSARTLLRSSPSVERLLTDLNIVLSDLTRPEMFATMVVVRVEAAGTVEFGLAGHLPILHVRGSDGSVMEHPNDALPLGIEPAERYRIGTTVLSAGDTLVLLTDGLTEVQNAAGRELGLGAIRDLLATRGREPLGELRAAVLSLAETHGTQIDDQSIVLIRRE